GRYTTPRFRYGQAAFEVRGEVTVVGLTAAPLPWPVGKRGRARSLGVYQGLARAARRESAQAVAHRWGVTPQTVTVWRKALGVAPTTQGTHRLRGAHALGPGGAAGREKAHAQSPDPPGDAPRRA